MKQDRLESIKAFNYLQSLNVGDEICDNEGCWHLVKDIDYENDNITISEVDSDRHINYEMQFDEFKRLFKTNGWNR